MLEMGFYCGLMILYPYAPVYCPREDCMGDCRGVYMYTSKSAPLPLDYKWCEAADHNLAGPKNWFQWKPRLLAPDRVKSIGAERICHWEDRGEPRDLNDLERSVPSR